MRIEDFKGVNDSTSDEDLEEVLAKRYGEGVNEFWLSHDGNKFPAMSIFVKGDIAALHYFQKEQDDPGMSSIGGKLNLEPGGTTIFYINTTEEEQEISNEAIVPFSLALKAAKEFSGHKEPPACIEWFVL